MAASGYYILHKRFLEKMQLLEIDNMQFFPAVFIDDDDNWHEHYMFLNIFDTLDCLDVERSEIYVAEDDEDDDDDDDEDEEVEVEVEVEVDKDEDVRHSVDRYYLSEEVLDNIDEEHRLIFKIAKTDRPFTIVHQRIKDVFDKMNATGARFIRVSDYTSGDQND